MIEINPEMCKRIDKKKQQPGQDGHCIEKW